MFVLLMFVLLVLCFFDQCLLRLFLISSDCVWVMAFSLSLFAKTLFLETTLASLKGALIDSLHHTNGNEFSRASPPFEGCPSFLGYF